jgi:predicted metal-binding protein
MEELTAQARSLGATAAVIIPAASLVVEDRFAALCGAPQRCPGYGLAPGCPPHALHPSVFREQLLAYRHILVFKIDAPVADLMSENRLPLARSIHRIAAILETTARSRGMLQARGLAAGSCKELFCAAEEACSVLNKQQPCRHPDLARPSISALGVNFTALAQSVGWPFDKVDLDQAAKDAPAMGLMAGLVLLD